MSRLPQIREVTTSRHVVAAGCDSARGQEARRRGRSLLPHGGNDRIYTPDSLARDIVRHFRPSGRILEPAAGGGAFLRALPPSCAWCEIDQGVDFLSFNGHYDWILTNPPYSLFTDFLIRSLQTADNIVFLCPVAAWFQRARERAIRNAKFGIVEICYVPVPPSPWPQFGLSLAATWLRRGWMGAVSTTRLPSSLWPPDGGDKMILSREESS